jgi:hypothetical protein
MAKTRGVPKILAHGPIAPAFVFDFVKVEEENPGAPAARRLLLRREQSAYYFQCRRAAGAPGRPLHKNGSVIETRMSGASAIRTRTKELSWDLVEPEQVGFRRLVLVSSVVAPHLLDVFSKVLAFADRQ